MIEISGYMGNRLIAHFLCTTNSTIEAEIKFKKHCKEADTCQKFIRPIDETNPNNLPLIVDYMQRQAII
jgi:hypothetical protein